MSRILSYKKIQHSWKISDNSKVYPNEESMRDSRTLLPEKFSPVRSKSKESQIFHASKEKLNLSKIKSSQPQVVTPKGRDNNPLFSSNYLTDSGQLPEGPKTGLLKHPDLASKESLILKNLESESPKKTAKASSGNAQLLKQANDFNWQAINKIKNEFYSFRAQVWTELMEQREMITKMAVELNKQFQGVKNGEERRVEESVFNGISSVDLSPKLESINQQINNFTTIITKFQQTEQGQTAEERIAPVQVAPFQQCIETPIAKLQEISKIPEKRSSPLDKCTHIAETIGILNEINSSPVKHSRSIQKQSVQQYKQKLLSICRSNEQLIKQPSRPLPPSDSQLKLKGNFKLDKFYSAIQKLKSQVNEIRNINQMKQLKKLKIVQVKE